MYIFRNAQQMVDWLARVKVPVSCLYQGKDWDGPRRVTGGPEDGIGGYFKFL